MNFLDCPMVGEFTGVFDKRTNNICSYPRDYCFYDLVNPLLGKK